MSLISLLVCACRWRLLERFCLDDASVPGGTIFPWATAFNFLQDALDQTGRGDEVWI